MHNEKNKIEMIILEIVRYRNTNKFMSKNDNYLVFKI
jgi:hypothetical protein